jgi:hypothetical protein
MASALFVRLAPALALALLGATARGATPSCPQRVDTGPRVVAELYTSEGCNSCPPADQWLASLPGDGSVLALAFHVDYWDSLGWADRFADPAYTARQRALQATSGARFVYTPQVIVDGRDFPAWRQTPPGALTSAVRSGQAVWPGHLALRREGSALVAEVGAAGSQRLAGYWALVESGHRSQVAAGENAGHALRHEHVVRRYTPLSAWPADTAREWRWSVPAAAPGHAGRAVFVLTDAAGGRPLAARQIELTGCSGSAS